MAASLPRCTMTLVPETTAGEPIMNDDELLTALREQRTKVSMTVPVEQVISRGRAVRARRRILVLAAVLVVVAALAALLSPRTALK
jgi:hypothetical protein